MNGLSIAMIHFLRDGHIRSASTDLQRIIGGWRGASAGQYADAKRLQARPPACNTASLKFILDLMQYCHVAELRLGYMAILLWSKNAL